MKDIAIKMLLTWKRSNHGVYPKLTAHALETTTKTLLTLSHPWSKSSPIGLDVPVRRA